MKIATWNVNSVKARLEPALAWLKQAEPDVLCLQEIKTVDEGFPREAFEALGYTCAVHGQKSYNGVAILSKRPMEDVTPRLHGDEAEPQGALVTMRGMKLQMFDEAGELQMVVQAPECIFDTVRHTVSSAGRLDVHSGDGRFSLAGQGFCFTQTNKMLTISNQVLTLLRPETKKQTNK